MANVLNVTVENPDEILNVGHSGPGAVIQVQSGPAVDGPYVDEAATIPIVAGTRLYTFFDADGDTSTWYRIRYETAAGVATSDWSTPRQAGGESGGLICSIYDVEQRLGAALVGNKRETMLDVLTEVTAAIEGYCGRWFVPRPVATYRIRTTAGSSLAFAKGIRSIDSLGIAASDQPESGGTYTALPGTAFYLDPPELERWPGWPATGIRLATGYQLYDAAFGAELTIAAGWPEPPAEVAGVGIEAAIRKWIGKERAEPSTFVGPAGNVAFLRNISPDSAAILNRFRVPVIA